MITIEPDASGNLVFEQYAFDDDDDTIRVIDVALLATNTIPVPADQRYPGWLRQGFNWTITQATEPDGRRKMTFAFTIPAAQLDPEKVYTIGLTITDDVAGHDPVVGTFDLMAQVTEAA